MTSWLGSRQRSSRTTSCSAAATRANSTSCRLALVWETTATHSWADFGCGMMTWASRERKKMTAMITPAPATEGYYCQLRLLLEELCCDLCRLEHVAKGSCRAEEIQVDREFYLDAPGAFADIRVAPPGGQ